MKHLLSVAGLALKALFLATILIAVPLDSVEAKKADKCSAEGQKPCPAHYKGPRCDKGLGNFGGICKRCGGEGMRACPVSAKGKQCFDKRMKIDGRCYARCGGPNQKACKKSKRGYPCKGSYEPDSRGFCKPCGGPGQKACRALKAGKQCKSGLTKIGGKCERCGGLNQKACPVLKAGKQCNSGLIKIKGTCQRCGGPNQQACPKLASGYPCKGKYEPDARNICKPCGGKGQKACRALKAGKRCNSGLKNIGGICQTCGGRGERACPKLAGGYPCRGKLEPNASNICTPCGGKGQKACRAFKAGKRCDPPLKNIGGTCTACGGPNERACPKLATGYPCRGQYEPNSAGICKPCGGVGQKACRVLKAGRQCAPGSTERGGVCVTCGQEDQRACKITDKGKACAEGLTRGLNGICKIMPKGETKRRAMAEQSNIKDDILPLLQMSKRVGENDNLRSQIQSTQDGDSGTDPGALPSIEDEGTRDICFGGRYGAITIGASVEAGVIVHGEGEAGIAIRCGRHARGQKDIKLYSSGSINVSLGAGGSAGVTVGLWKPDFNDLRGKSHGYVLDLSDLFTTGKAVASKSLTDALEGAKKLGWDVALGVWFERLDEDGDGKENEVGAFSGFTISVSKAMDLDVGGIYVRATTVQKCDTDMKCTEGFWANGDTVVHITRQTENGFHASINDDRATRITKRSYRKYDNDDVGKFRFRKNFKLLKFKPAGGSEIELREVTVPSAEGVWSGQIESVNTSIVIDEQFKNHTKVEDGRDIREEYFFAAVGGEPRKRFDRTFGRTWKSSDGDTIKFRKNWTLLRYKSDGGDKGELTKSGDAPLPEAPSGINVVGLWDFHVNRTTHTEEIVSQDAEKIVVRRLDTEIERTYRKTAENIYVGDHEGGGTFRFVTDTRALWISGDRKSAFQLNKREE